MKSWHRWLLVTLAVAALAVVSTWNPRLARAGEEAPTATKIKHVVVIFQENVSFDHYFATYPFAQNPSGEPGFLARANTPSVNNLLSAGLMVNNPNSTQPFRLDRSQAFTCDQDHDYGPEQQAFDMGLMDKFPEFTGVASDGSCADFGKGTGLTMGYFDGNTPTALWNYAQHFAMSDNSFGTGFGPSTPGALNLVSGQTNGVDMTHTTGTITADIAGGSVIGDPDPFYDDCGSPEQLAVTGTNVGDLLNAKGVTWGWFQGGFTPTTPASATTPAACASQTANTAGVLQKDYSAHHEPFEYYASTANVHHLPPSSVAMIGHTDQANHQYDLTSFWAAVKAANPPAVSFLKAKRSQDGHAGYSSPLDEQIFIVETLNRLQRTPEWRETAVIIAYDDSDGWYDHVLGPIIRQSNTSSDALTGSGNCGTASSNAIQGQCGYGPRVPFFVISPWAKVNYVDHSVTDQSSIIRFIEDNWGLGRIGGGSSDALAGTLLNMFDFSDGPRAGRLFLNPSTGERVGDED